MADGRHIENRFGYMSKIFLCPINTKFGMKKQNHTQTQFTWPKYQTEFCLWVIICRPKIWWVHCSELIGDVFLCWLFYKDKSAICTQQKFLI